MKHVRRTVLVADIVSSRRIPANARAAVQRRILAFLGGQGAFQVSGGDEFEWALPDVPESLDDILRLRLLLATPTHEAPAIRLRCGIGRGDVLVVVPNAPYAEDGPAYHRARQGIVSLRGTSTRGQRDPNAPLSSARSTKRFTALVDDRHDPLRDALLAHMDHLEQHWTPPQRDAIAMAAAGLRYVDIGDRLGVSLQAVQKRLSAANWDLYLQGHEAVKASWGDARED